MILVLWSKCKMPMCIFCSVFKLTPLRVDTTSTTTSSFSRVAARSRDVGEDGFDSTSGAKDKRAPAPPNLPALCASDDAFGTRKEEEGFSRNAANPAAAMDV